MCPTTTTTTIIDALQQALSSSAVALFKEAGGARNIRTYALQSAMGTSNLELIKTVIEIFSITPEEVRSINFFQCCFRPSKELVQWWVEMCKSSKADLVKMFNQLCLRGGMADTARNLATQFNFTKDDLLSVNKTPYALLNACKRGDLELVKWIIETYDFTLDDIEICDLFHEVLFYINNPAILQYLISKFSFDRDYAIEAFYYACGNGDLNIVKTLANFYQYTLPEVREKNRVLIDYCDDSDVREWILDTYYKDIATN